MRVLQYCMKRIPPWSMDKRKLTSLRRRSQNSLSTLVRSFGHSTERDAHHIRGLKKKRKGDSQRGHSRREEEQQRRREQCWRLKINLFCSLSVPYFCAALLFFFLLDVLRRVFVFFLFSRNISNKESHRRCSTPRGRCGCSRRGAPSHVHVSATPPLPPPLPRIPPRHRQGEEGR